VLPLERRSLKAVAVYCENDTKYVSTLCGQHAILVLGLLVRVETARF
jgi:hypothetical protein